MRRFVPLVPVLLFVSGLFLSGCEKESTRPTGGDSASQTTGSLQVELIPPEPRIGNCVEVRIGQSAGRVTYAWKINGIAVENETEMLCDERLKKAAVVQVEARDSNGSQLLQTVFANTPPRILRLEQDPPKLIAGMPLTIVPVVHDPDMDVVTYTCRWFVNDNEIYDVTETTLPGDRFIGGDTITVDVLPNDGQDNGEVYQSGSITIPNAAPRFLTKPPTEIQGTTLTYKVVAEDPDGGTVTYSLAKAPPGMTIDAASGNLVWVVPADWNGLAEVEIVAVDVAGERISQRFNLDLTRN